MTRATRLRLLAFLVLSAVGITYVAAAYLGIVDRVLGRGFTVHATLPTSGGLYEGSEVDYRGVKIGRVSSMHVTRDGVRVDLALEEGTKLPLDAPLFVHNLSAVGEQYLDFEPPDDEGPYAREGSTFTGTEKSLPVDEGDLLVQLDAFVNSVDKGALRTVVSELGDMFAGTGQPLQQLIDSGSRFIDEASEHTDDTIRLLRTGLTVLRTQNAQGDNIRSFARDLSRLTATLRRSDGDLRSVLDHAPGAAKEFQKLLEQLEPTLPVLLGSLIDVDQVVVSHLAGTEQLLVTFPRVIAGGFTGSPPDGYGHVNLQFDYSVPPCTQGYKPPSQWRRGDQLTDAPIYPAQCTAGPPYVMRGTPHVPGTAGNPSPARTYRGTYDPRTGVVTGAVDKHGKQVRFSDPGDLSILGDDSWKWLLVGPTVAER